MRKSRRKHASLMTREIFTVTKIIPRVPPVYRLRDYADHEIEGMFYAEESQKAR